MLKQIIIFLGIVLSNNQIENVILKSMEKFNESNFNFVLMNPIISQINKNYNNIFELNINENLLTQKINIINKIININSNQVVETINEIKNNDFKYLIVVNNSEDFDLNEIFNNLDPYKTNIIINQELKFNNRVLEQKLNKKLYKVVIGVFTWVFIFVTIYLMYSMFNMDVYRDTLVYSNIISDKKSN